MFFCSFRLPHPLAKYSSHVTSVIKRSRPYFYTASSWGTAAEWKLWACMCVWGCLEDCHEGESLTLTQIGLLYRCQDPGSMQHNTRSHQETCYTSKACSFVTVLQFSVLASNHPKDQTEKANSNAVWASSSGQEIYTVNIGFLSMVNQELKTFF